MIQNQRTHDNVINQDAIEKQLALGFEALHIDIDDAKVQLIVRLVYHIIKWNRVYNLTSITDPTEIVIKHILDCAAVYPHLNQEQSLLDVGSGAGLPCIVLAILNPKWNISSVDSNGKKIRFQQYIKAQFNLQYFTPYHARVQDLKSKSLTFEQVISRAFSSTENCIDWCEDLLLQGNRLFIMKAKNESTITSYKGFALQQTNALTIPDLQAFRSLECFVKS